MNEILLWKKLALHCPKCDNVFDLIWLDGKDRLGECLTRCQECLTEFIATAKLFKTRGEKHGLRGQPSIMDESLNAKARRKARE